MHGLGITVSLDPLGNVAASMPATVVLDNEQLVIRVEHTHLCEHLCCNTHVLFLSNERMFLARFQVQESVEVLPFSRLPRVDLLHIDEITTKFFGEIATQLRQNGRPIRQDDMWIAALCKQHGYALATADKDFDTVVGLEIVSF